jgi:hypothetical protein
MPRLPPGPVSIALASLRNSVVLRLILHCLSIDDFWLISHEDESDGSSELLLHGNFSIGKWQKGWGLGSMMTEARIPGRSSASPLLEE